MKKAVCTGINDYPGTANDLYGCANDAQDWGKIFEDLGFAVTVFTDSKVTKARVLTALKDLADNSQTGDVLVFSYSGHGTQVKDISGDEPDGYDEALYLYDGTLIDDDIRDAIRNLNEDAIFVFISDSCFSGTVTRNSCEFRRKFVQTEPELKNTVVCKIFEPREDMKEILLSGCKDNEYSYDAYIDGRYGGAFSHYAQKAFKDNPKATYNEWYAELRKHLPTTNLPQTPQLEGTEAHKNMQMFIGIDEEPEPPTPDDDPLKELLEQLIKFIELIYTWLINLFKAKYG
jgi:hypothetical protein